MPTDETQDLGREGAWGTAFADPALPEAPVETAQEPSQEKLIADRVRAEIEEQVVQAIINEDTNSGVYKGMQRVVSRHANENQRLARELEAANLRAYQQQQELAQMRSQVEELNPAIAFLGQTLMENLPDETRAAAVGKLQQISAERNTKAMQAQIAQLQQQAIRPVVVAPQPQVDDSALEEELNRRIAQHVQALQKTAADVGLDPADKRLDYGSDDDFPAVRAQKLTASIAKVLKETNGELDSLKTGNREATRTSGGGLISPDTGTSLLQRGAQKRLEMMRRASS